MGINMTYNVMIDCFACTQPHHVHL